MTYAYPDRGSTLSRSRCRRVTKRSNGPRVSVLFSLQHLGCECRSPVDHEAAAGMPGDHDPWNQVPFGALCWLVELRYAATAAE